MKKNIFSFSLISILFLNGIIYAQPVSLITTIDTLADGKAIVTIEKQDSSFYGKYLMLSQPYDWITGSVASPGDISESTDEHLIKNIEIPDNFGGCFPQDAVYNPGNNTFYVYAGRKVILIDGATKQKTGEIIVSDIDRTTDHNLCLNIKNKIVINQQYSKLYCATEAGTLVIIDLSTNTIVTTINSYITLQELIKSSVIYHQATNMAYWYVSAGNTGNVTNRIGKVDGVNNSEVAVHDDFEFGINDITCNITGSQLYAATTNGIYEFSCSNLSTEPAPIVTGFNSLCLLYTTNNILFAGKEGDNKIYYHEFSTPFNSGYINNRSVSGISRFAYNTNENKLYYIGVVGSVNETGIRIMDVADYSEFGVSQTYDYDYLMGLEYSCSNNTIYIGGLGTILSINGNTNTISLPQDTDGSFCTNIVTDNSANTQILSVQNTTGNLMVFNADLSSSSLLDIGNYVIGSCTKNSTGQLFIVATKNNFTSSLWIYDLNTKSMESSVALPVPVNAVSISCNDADDYVFIAGNDVNDYGKVCIYNISTNTFLSTINIDHDGQTSCTIYKMITDPNSNSYLLTYKADSSKDPCFFAINETGIFFDDVFPDLNACFQDFVYYDNDIEHPRVFVQSKCSLDIFVYDCSENDWDWPNAFTNLTIPPLSICIVPENDVIYVGSYKYIKWYNASTYNYIDEYNTTASRKFTKIFYCKFQDKVYAWSDDNKITILYENDLVGIIENKDMRDAIYNPLNDRLYLFNTNNDSRTIKVDVLDCCSDQITHTINTGTSYTLLKWNDYYSAESTPPSFILGDENNLLYACNMPFSNISEIGCYTDKLGLQDGWNWRSFPRLERVGNSPDFSETILSRINYFPQLELHMIEDFDGDPFKDFDNMTWDGFLDDVFSTDGYKFDLTLIDSPQPDIALHGAKLDPSTELTIYPNQENWVGYFIEEAQMPEDAIPAGDLAHITFIRAQYWSMTRIPSEPEWFIKGRVTPIHYGDMIIIEVDEQRTFAWNQPQEAAEEMETLFTENYQYEEQADYLPIFVETDAASDIQEIAVLANCEVVGAAVRLPGDTLVEVNAYLEDVPPGTPLEFETWSGYKSAPIEKGSYSVKNPFSGLYEKRSIYKGENAKFHIASLKAGTVAHTPSCISDAKCAPNPFSRETLITFRLNSGSIVNLCIFDQNGKMVRELMDSPIPAGYYKLAWDGTNNRGHQLENGVYFLRLKAGEENEIKGKVVLIK